MKPGIWLLGAQWGPPGKNAKVQEAVEAVGLLLRLLELLHFSLGTPMSKSLGRTWVPRQGEENFARKNQVDSNLHVSRYLLNRVENSVSCIYINEFLQ
jgi:hypothetical protein